MLQTLYQSFFADSRPSIALCAVLALATGAALYRRQAITRSGLAAAMVSTLLIASLLIWGLS